MADILRGFTYDSRAARYRDLTTGRYIARDRGPNSIAALLTRHIDGAEQRLGNIVQGMAAGEIKPGMGQVLIRDELRRANLSAAALAKGGWDRLTPADYGRVGRQLRDSYSRMTNLAADVRDGKTTLPQALNRVRGYVGEVRQQYFAQSREALRATGQRMEARRVLNPAEHCVDCVRLAGLGWRPMEEIPIPGDGSTQCGIYDKCSIEYRVAVAETEERRMLA